MEAYSKPSSTRKEGFEVNASRYLKISFYLCQQEDMLLRILI